MAPAPAKANSVQKLLCSLFEQHGVTPYRCAKIIDAHHPQIYEVLRGDRALSELLALKLATYFQVEPETLLAAQTSERLTELRKANSDVLARIREKASQ